MSDTALPANSSAPIFGDPAQDNGEPEELRHYELGPDSLPREGVPTGTVTEGVLAPGRHYPGAPHVYRIYTPAGADGSTPLPVTVVLDNWVMALPRMGLFAALDNLIAAGEIPPMMAVLVDPGVTPAAEEAAQQHRWERSFEYDSLSDRFSRFVVDELLAEVAKVHPLTDDPDERAIVGASTGAVGAFVTAWHRPDVFHRVLTLVGTFVAMRGGDTLAELVRKTEPKPLRAWLQYGRFDHITRDQPYGSFYAGSWPVASRTLFEGLQFGGYDARLNEGYGPHDMEHSSFQLPDALRWLWQGWTPEAGVPPVVPRPPAALDTPGWDTRGSIWATIDGLAGWVPVETGYAVMDLAVRSDGGLVLRGDDGSLALVDLVDPATATATPLPVAGAAAGAGAVATGDGDALFLAVDGGIVDGDGRHVATWTSSTPPAALLWDGAGRLYLLDGPGRRIGVVDVAGGTGEPRWSGIDLHTPSGLALSPDRAQLIVTDAERRTQWSFLLDAGGDPRHGEPFFRMETLDDLGEAYGAATDSTGQVYFATPLGVQVSEPIGRVAMVLNPPVVPTLAGPVTAVAFAGAGFGQLCVVQDGRLYRRPMKVHGAPVQAPVRPEAPPL